MKKLNQLGKILTRQEMKSVSGGNPPGGGNCLYNSPTPCGPGCQYNADGSPVFPKAYQCVPTSTGGDCLYTACLVAIQ